METFLYLAKVNLYWVLFYACYWLLLRKHTFFQWNRIYLLGSLLIAFALPAVRLAEPVTTIHVPANLYHKATISVAVVANHAQDPQANVGAWLIGLYIAVVSAFLGRFCLGIYRLLKAAAHSERIDMEHYTLLLLPDNGPSRSVSSFSFFRWLFLSAPDYRHNPDTVIRHEYEHIRQWHTADILVIEILKIACWCNPVLWLYKRSIETVHEYLADQPVAHRPDYASFLVAYALRSPDISLANHFFNGSLLKSRIKMMYKKRSSRWLLTRYLFILPVVGCSLAITASKAPLHSITQMSAVTEQDIKVKGNITDENKAPVADAIVIIAGTTRGTTTDRNGWFELDNVPADAQLVITHVAYQTLEWKVGNSPAELLLVMKKAVNQITGAVVVGKPVTPGTTAAMALPARVENTDMKVVEQQPEFPGGRDALMRYLMQNLQYPETARKINVEAIALVAFTVDKNGDIRNAKSLKNIGYGIDKEALRVVNEMPKWNPAVQNGKPVEMEYTLEVNFKLEKDSQDKRQGFLNFNTVSPAMEKIGQLFNDSPNVLAAGKAPEVTYWSMGYTVSNSAVIDYMENEKGKYRFVNYGGQYIKNPPLKWRKIEHK
ncbi:hypothetical protein GCM10010967_52880 [Dyadobacter beijingensis]|uniref:TonB C-terminal domain-containing protein n=1 Tax=Dyadobacter beijingensis TaxID=365489 RepID=A0ABQ2ILJ0_9BACT|nr:TonB family protein [Dyadobacter beijingensis]GGN10443.1 hypothetical protein GCM10010967_52880 [Dyadobacter beijingensis]